MISSIERRNCSRKADAPVKSDRKSGAPYSITDCGNSVEHRRRRDAAAVVVEQGFEVYGGTESRSVVSCCARVRGGSCAASGLSSISRSRIEGSRFTGGLAIAGAGPQAPAAWALKLLILPNTQNALARSPSPSKETPQPQRLNRRAPRLP